MGDGTEPVHGIEAAALLCQVSRDTIKRRLADGRLPGAYRGRGPGPKGPWLIPESSLTAAGMLTSHAEQSGETLEQLRRRAAVAEAKLAEVRSQVNDMRAMACWTRCRLVAETLR